MENSTAKEKIIPVLAKTGGREALNIVLKEFENGNPEMRDVCFKTLTSWQDYKASSALYEICASGNKTFEEPAFNSYIRQIRLAHYLMNKNCFFSARSCHTHLVRNGRMK